MPNGRRRVADWERGAPPEGSIISRLIWRPLPSPRDTNEERGRCWLTLTASHETPLPVRSMRRRPSGCGLESVADCNRPGARQLGRVPRVSGAAGTAGCRWGALAIRVSSLCLSLYTTVSVGWSDACEAGLEVSPAVERNVYMASAVSSDVSHCCALRSWSSHCLISSMRCRLSGMTWLMASMAATTVGMR